MTLSRLLQERAVERGDHTFLFWQDEHISYRVMAQRAEQVAAALAENGVGPGDSVGIVMPNCPEFLYSLFGCWRAGAVACPINPALTAEEAGYILDNAQVKLVLREGLYSDGAPPPTPTDEQAVASLIYTSGTTGHPKGVMLTHANYLWDTEATVLAVGLTPEDRFLCILPLFHVNAQVATTLAPLMGGSQMVLLPRFSPDTFLHDVSRYRATAFSAVPTVYSILLSRGTPEGLDLSSLRFGICGAAPLPVEVFEQFEARFGIKILEGYGLSEATCVSSVNPATGHRKIGSIGLPLDGQAMRIVDDQSHPVHDGIVGEIVVSGPNVMRGYFNNADATSEVLRDGWLHTGDLGVRDEDGYFTIVGRKKDMIIRGGENVYPKEIEEVLHRHPAISEAAVIGLPDPVWGEQVAAIITVRTAVEVSEVQAWCRQHLAPYKQPVRIFIVDPAEIPRTPTGKIQKNRLRESLTAERAQP